MTPFKTFRLLFYTCFSIALIAAYVVYNHAIKTPLTNRDQQLVIPKGVGVAWLAQHLEKQGVIESATLFRLYTIFNQQAVSLKAGEYTLVDVETIPELVNKLSEGRVIQYALTLIEGKTFKDYLALLADQKGLEKELTDLSADEIMQQVGSSGIHPEGQFAPETYFYQKGDSDLDILKKAHQRLKNQLAIIWEERSEDIEITRPYDLLILASIIEKETGAEFEREIISGVFNNRLRIGMKLQTDPTVIYGMGDSYDGNIRRKDLTTDTPYNTYTRYGLPPSPIAMAGRASLKAAAHPEQTKALYFVGKGDGTHYFSNNLKQHNAAVVKYQLKGRGS